MKTLIELFDACQTDNVVAAMKYAPEKIIFVGFKETMTQKRTADLERFFEMSGQRVIVEYEIVGRYNFDAIVAALERLADANDDCCFDLTGGKEMVLAAMGYVANARGIPMVQVDVKTGKVFPIKYFDASSATPEISMTIEECISLNGGSVVHDDENVVFWNLTPDFKADVDIMWALCRPNCGLWNKHCCIFAELEYYGDLDENYWLHVDFAYLRSRGHDYYLNQELMNALVENGLLTEYVTEGDKLSFRYKNAQVWKCLTKAGSILELHTYLTAMEIENQTPGYYDDLGVGVVVDWDGVLHGEFAAERDTRNELDVVLMRGMVPVIISCKNGEVHKEALYELATVAERYGGAYAKKVLLTTYLNNDAASRQFILQRAKDMGITVLENVHLLEQDEFAQLLRVKTK